jgi:2-polyprenyl-3-methyl-5-hydroxy-6-metoxy-1,4-benzoquinol methylase
MKNEAIRNMYDEMGVDNYYKVSGNSYTNPHETIIQEHLDHQISQLNTHSVLDLCAGSGEVSKHLKKQGIVNITGLDPYTFKLYEKETQFECLQYNFDDIMTGKLNKEYSLIICSFALHLADKSKLPLICYHLSRIADQLLIITPHKNPIIDNFWKLEQEHYKNKVRSRLYSKV